MTGARRRGRDPAKFNLGALAGGSEGYTGSEIEQVFIEALYAAFADGKEPATLSVSMALDELVPLSKLMAEQVAEYAEVGEGEGQNGDVARRGACWEEARCMMHKGLQLAVAPFFLTFRYLLERKACANEPNSGPEVPKISPLEPFSEWKSWFFADE